MIYHSEMARKHSIPAFLEGMVDSDAYVRWLGRKAAAHVKRDRDRGQSAVTRPLYKEAIHAAVLLSDGRDACTGEVLQWRLISTYKNEDSKAGRHTYKSGFALLPTVDHVAAGATEASFRICAWRTNDAKSDLSPEEFIELCIKVLVHAGYSATKRD
jgi:hypothetical protein